LILDSAWLINVEFKELIRSSPLPCEVFTTLAGKRRPSFEVLVALKRYIYNIYGRVLFKPRSKFALNG
jgi:hypothetical protein